MTPAQVAMACAKMCHDHESMQFDEYVKKYGASTPQHAMSCLAEKLRASPDEADQRDAARYRWLRENQDKACVWGDHPCPRKDITRTPRPDCVICPACCHQFGAISVNDQQNRSELERAFENEKATSAHLEELGHMCDAALREGAAILLQVAEMEEHNEAIFKGKWKKGSKAWSGDFIKRLRAEGMAKVREAMAAT